MSKRLPGIGLVVVLLFMAWGCAPTMQNRRDDLVDLYNKGKYAEAIPLARETLALAEREKGPNDPEVAASLNLLGLMYYTMGDFTSAEPLFLRALSIREKNLAPDDAEIATSLNNLALLYDAMGDYARAEPYFRRALEIREKTLDKNHPDVAASLNNLAGLYYALGDYNRAIPLYQRAIDIWEESLGKDHPDLAASLSNLAGLYASTGRYEMAEPLYERALSIREEALGAGHPDVAASLNNLALLYQEQGDYTRAAPLYQRALGNLETSLGPNHPDVAATLNNLALLYSAQGRFDEARAMYERSLAIVEKVYGPDHPDVAAGLDNLAGLYAARGDYSKAQQLFKRSQVIDAKLIDQVLGFTSEDEKASFLATKQSSLEGSLSLVAQHLQHDPQARADALSAWLARKGIILEAQRQFQEALVHSDNPETIQVFQQLSTVRTQLSRLTFAGPGQSDPEDYRSSIEELERQKDRLEADLSRMSQSYARQRKVQRADAAAVARALPAGTVLIEYARVHMFNFRTAGGQSRWLPPHYLAFVLASGDGSVQMADLGDAEEIDRAVTQLKKAVTDFRDKDGQKAASASLAIYNRVFAPLERYLGGSRRIFVSPDGNLNLIPFEILSRPDGRYLIEDFAFNYISAGRDILGFGGASAVSGPPVLMGDPDFDLSGQEKTQIMARLGLQPGDEQAMPAQRAVELRGLNFSRLPGTREEVQAIQGILGQDQSRLYTGSDALEEVLRNLQTPPRILHLATHGFFLSDSQFSSLVASGKDKGKNAVNPLLRSGLALAGANRALASGGSGDGIMTAEKVLGLRLRGTSLVVLSACETGLGEIKSGEGVYGLRRAFTQAGAESLVMSMWSVPDKETQELMVEFYRNVDSGMEKSEALRQAALKQVQVVRDRYGRPNPFFWGAFVFLGQPS